MRILSRPTRNKILASLVGMLFAWLALEIFLAGMGRLAGEVDSPPPSATGTFTVLCLGNSYTYGADHARSYCAQLEENLRSVPNLRGREVKTVNLGRFALNTAAIRAALPEQLTKYRPSVVLLMAGEPNFWNRSGFTGARGTGLANGFWRETLYATATYRLGRQLWNRWQGLDQASSNSPLGRAYQATGELYEQPPEFFDSIPEATASSSASELNDKIFADPAKTSPALYVVAARLHFQAGDPNRAEQLYRECLRQFKGDCAFDVYRDLAAFSLADARLIASAEQYLPKSEVLNRLLETIRWVDTDRIKSVRPTARLRARAAEVDHLARLRPADVRLNQMLMALPLRRSPSAILGAARQALRWNPYSKYGALNIPLQALALHPVQGLDEDVAYLQKLFPQEPKFRHLRDKEAILQWITEDISAISDELAGRGVPLILQTYPPDRDLPPRLADLAMKDLAVARKIPLCDTRTHLLEIFRSVPNRELYYRQTGGAPDNHLSVEGDRLVADQLRGCLVDTLWPNSKE